uniref:Uncharacterized protein n=1 Tax=Arundo donax TaxID=35708 RepID=A0A0A9FSL6_ARUDO
MMYLFVLGFQSGLEIDSFFVELLQMRKDLEGFSLYAIQLGLVFLGSALVRLHLFQQLRLYGSIDHLLSCPHYPYLMVLDEHHRSQDLYKLVG